MTGGAGLPRSWIGVVSRNHVLKGVEQSIAMLNRGKLAPLLRLRPGDWLIYYSPRTDYPHGDMLKAFTAFGTVKDEAPYQGAMAPGVTGFRRNIDWRKATETSLESLTNTLEFTRGNWGLLARRGLFEITAADSARIRAAMTKG